MNKEIISILKSNNIHPVSYQKIKSVYLIKDKKNSYIIKLNTNNYDIYKYLISKNFNYFPKNYNSNNDNYDISEYIPNLNIAIDQKVNDYLRILAILHLKTSYKREIDLDYIKEKYEGLLNEINYLRKYYYELNNKIDKEIFLSPDAYLLVRNISLIYSTLTLLEERLKKLYENIKTEKSMRVSLLHNNLSLEHLLINEKEYLISWDKAYFDSPIYELNNFYREYYQSITINDFLMNYENINKLSSNEKELLLIMLAIPKEIKFTNNTYLNTKNINLEINYLKSIYEMLSLVKE